MGSQEIMLINYLEPAFTKLRRVWIFVPIRRPETYYPRSGFDPKSAPDPLRK